jgi:hypothetical protein
MKGRFRKYTVCGTVEIVYSVYSVHYSRFNDRKYNRDTNCLRKATETKPEISHTLSASYTLQNTVNHSS